MYLSKIWFFLVAVVGAIALVVALVMPRPAQRGVAAEENQRLAVACGIVDILLTDDARNRVDLTGSFARTPEVVAALEAASGTDKLDEARMKQVREIGENVMKTIQGRKPDFAMLIDRRGRVVARVKLEQDDFGDVVAGRPLVDDALAGYLRDDLWAQNSTMYFVSAAPVIKRDAPVTYVGAVVLGHAVTNELAGKLVQSLNVDIGFFLGDNDVAGSKSIGFDHTAMLGAASKLTGGDRSRDCQANQPMDLSAGNDRFTSIVARLPGEAASKQAFYSVFIKQPESIGFMATLHTVKQGDLSFSNFPWLLVGGGFLVALVIGIGLMFIETDRPLGRLTADAMKLNSAHAERLAEESHPGRYGSIARSVNSHIDKVTRDAKSARKDMDQLLGPAPDGSLGTIDLLATALPSVRPGGPGPSAPPPPSEFKFDMAPPSSRPMPAPLPPAPAPMPAMPPQAPPRVAPPIPAKPAAPPAAPATFVAAAPSRPTPPPAAPAAPMASARSAGLSLDDDILGPEVATTVGGPALGAGVDPYFNQVYEQFVAVKKSCGEPTTGLTYAKFAEKLVKNREDLMSKTHCKEVRFTVYVKDGKAALKATPVKDEG